MVKTIKVIQFEDKGLTTEHLKEREDRYSTYKDLLSTNFIRCFLVDTEHPCGLEVHCINEHGLIYIYNYDSKRFITVLHPRPSQLKRYYRQLGMRYGSHISKLGRECYNRNENNDYNNK
jgi:hypothetical protein